MTEFLWPVRVYYEDTDSGGVVYHANYLKFLERARTEWLRSLGFEQDQLREGDGLLFAVKDVWMDLRRPARFNQRLTVGTALSARKSASLTFVQRIFLPDRPDENLCEARIRVACLAAESFRPCRIPEAVIARIPHVG